MPDVTCRQTDAYADWLNASHRGQGVMSAVVKTLMQEWAIPRMNVRFMIVSAYIGNRASLRVFEKNGFSYVKDVQDVIQFPESKGGGMKGLHVLEWRYEPHASGAME